MAKEKNKRSKGARPDDIDPKHRWDRPLQAPGRTQVDFEERVDFRRLHDYRLARTRAALSHSGLGALLCFDQHNIRYITSTVIGEWARDKLTRYSLLTGKTTSVTDDINEVTVQVVNLVTTHRAQMQPQA